MPIHAKKRDVADLDRVIRIYKATEVNTDYSYRTTFTLISEQFAQLVAKTRKMTEDISAGKESSMQEVHWRIRVETDVTTNYYIWYDSQWYDIITILPENRDYQLLVTELKHDAQWPSP